MLGKLIKHEFIDTWKLLVLLDVAIVVIGAILGLTINNSSIGVGLYILMLPSLGTIHLVYVGVHYYKSLYSSQGYLTFTLPATTNEILFSKMFAAFIFEVINSLCIIVSFGLVMWGIYWSLDSNSFWSSVFSGSWEDITEVFSDIPVSISGIISVLAFMIFTLMTFFLAISLGQLWQKHRIIGAIVSYFGIKIVLAIASSIIRAALISNDIYDSFNLSYYSDIDSGSALIIDSLIQAVQYLLISAAMYFGCVYITKHKLNLE